MTTYSNTGLSRNTTYYYQVCAYDAAGNSLPSNTANDTTFAEASLPTPSNLAATPISTNQVYLTWTDTSNGQAGFRIERSLTGAEGSFLPITSLAPGVTSYTDSWNLIAGNTYYYRMRAYNSNGNSAYTDPVNVKM